jgi:hypothetical protein
MVQEYDTLHHQAHFQTRADFWWWFRVTGGFYPCPAIPHAVPTLKRLRDAGHHIVFVTARPSWAEEDTYRWLAMRGLQDQPVVFTTEKETHTSFDIYIDDNPLLLSRLATATGPNQQVVRYAQPWNSPVAGVRTMVSWYEIDHILTREDRP